MSNSPQRSIYLFFLRACTLVLLSRVLPRLGFVEALVGDGHDLLENIPYVLLRLTEGLLLPNRIGVTHVGLRESAESAHASQHSGLIIHNTLKPNLAVSPPQTNENVYQRPVLVTMYHQQREYKRGAGRTTR